MALEREVFFTNLEQQGLPVTFDDVMLATAPSDVTAATADVSTLFTRNVELRVPLVSAAMDTVTTANMAIAMAKSGGIGVLHAALDVEQQAQAVRKVKHLLGGLVEDPRTFKQTMTLGEALQEHDRRDFDFWTYPIVDEQDRFVGIITHNDFDFNMGNKDILLKDAMTQADEVVTGPPGISPTEAFSLMKEYKKKTIPLIDKDGTVRSLYVLSDVVRSLNGNPDEYNLDDLGRLKVAAAVPTNEQALERIEAMQGYLDVAVVDTAHGNSIHASQTVSLIKESYPDLEVMAGNVSDGESAKVLVDAGADGVKVGQGPGSICSTRIEAGIGTPQITAIYECVKAIKGSGVPICADGGIVYRGDISKAIAAGASSVMMGRMLAGTDEAPGTTTLYQGVVLKDYRGMGSLAAFKDSEASRQRYGVDMSRGIPAPEGVEARVQCVGPAKDVVDLCVKALKISMSYVGSPDIKTHRTRTRFNRITNAGMNESRPHDIMII